MDPDHSKRRIISPSVADSSETVQIIYFRNDERPEDTLITITPLSVNHLSVYLYKYGGKCTVEYVELNPTSLRTLNQFLISAVTRIYVCFSTQSRVTVNTVRSVHSILKN